MDGVIRYTAGDALTESTRAARAGFDPGHWVRAADFDERQFQGKQREVALQDRLTERDEQLDTQRLRADTAEAELADLEGDIVLALPDVLFEKYPDCKSPNLGEQVKRMAAALPAAEQRIAELSAKNQQLSQLLGQTLAALNPTARLAKEIKVALNLKTEVSQ